MGSMYCIMGTVPKIYVAKFQGKNPSLECFLNYGISLVVYMWGAHWSMCLKCCYQ